MPVGHMDERGREKVGGFWYIYLYIYHDAIQRDCCVGSLVISTYKQNNTSLFSLSHLQSTKSTMPDPEETPATSVEEDTRSPTPEIVPPRQETLASPALLAKIDKLREKNIGKHVPLPQV